MRLIDADEAYKVLTDYYHHRTELQHEALKEAFERVPTVDAEPVVRCKDCKKWETINCPFARDFVKWDGFKFCAWGERKENAN